MFVLHFLKIIIREVWYRVWDRLYIVHLHFCFIYHAFLCVEMQFIIAASE